LSQIILLIFILTIKYHFHVIDVSVPLNHNIYVIFDQVFSKLISSYDAFKL